MPSARNRQPLSELVLDDILVDERRDLADEGEIQRVIAEARDEAHERSRFHEEPGNLASGRCPWLPGVSGATSSPIGPRGPPRPRESR
jgi:hypothetical protein